MNSSGVIHVRVSRMASESTLSSILKFVELAQSSRPPIQRLSDRVSSWFIPVIFGLSFGVFTIWIGLVYSDTVQVENYGKFPFCLQFLIAVLVVSCPCAIALAVPGTIVIASGVASKFGILFKVHLQVGFKLISRRTLLNSKVAEKSTSSSSTRREL